MTDKICVPQNGIWMVLFVLLQKLLVRCNTLIGMGFIGNGMRNAPMNSIPMHM
jgi:hypothetical protein